MISKRDKLLNYPFEQQRYVQHLEKVHSARPAIDFRTPPTYSHVIMKPKKIQFEKERLKRIEQENVRLLQKLGDIMRTKRLENFWQAPRPNFLNREKLFETRPHTSNNRQNYNPYYEMCLKSPNLKTAARCPTCSGVPERTETVNNFKEQMHFTTIGPDFFPGVEAKFFSFFYILYGCFFFIITLYYFIKKFVKLLLFC